MAQLLQITKNAKSPKKIKERLKQHGHEWYLLKDDTYEGKPAVLVGSMQDDSKYIRWFLKDEVEITYL